MAKTFVWTGAEDANFGNAGNWNDITDGLNPATAAPGAQDTAEFVTGGGTISGTGTVATLLFSGLDPWVLTAGASLSDTDSFSNGGTVTVQDGATLESSAPNDNGIANGDGTAKLVIAGPGSQFIVDSITSSVAIAGSLAAINGGTAILSGQATMDGTIEVDGSSKISIGPASEAVLGAVTIAGYHTLEGSGTIVGNLVNGYQVVVSGSGAQMEITGAVTGSGPYEFAITGDGTLQFDSAVASAPLIVFANDQAVEDTEALRLLDPLASSASLYDFGLGGSDVLELAGQTVTGVGTYGYTLTVSLAQGGPLSFGLPSGGTSGLSFSGDKVFAGAEPPCFRVGTLIATPLGNRAIEDLREGDLVSLARGGVEHVAWIGHRYVDCRRHPDPKRVWPVRVLADAFGPHRPQRDLWLSPQHAIYFADVLIPIKELINGTSIAQVPLGALTYYHVELPQHDVLLAEGLPAEAYLDSGDRANFANGSDFVRLFPDFSKTTSDAAAVWEAHGCAPLVVSGPVLAAIRNFVNLQAA
jgi:collagen type I/II/III/V/XI/XXIV/XXVII alpha